MNNIKPVCVSEELVSFLKDVADETNSTISSVADYYLRIATRDLEKPKAEDVSPRKKRGRKPGTANTVKEVEENNVVSLQNFLG